MSRNSTRSPWREFARQVSLLSTPIGPWPRVIQIFRATCRAVPRTWKIHTHHYFSRVTNSHRGSGPYSMWSGRIPCREGPSISRKCQSLPRWSRRRMASVLDRLPRIGALFLADIQRFRSFGYEYVRRAARSRLQWEPAFVSEKRKSLVRHVLFHDAAKRPFREFGCVRARRSWLRYARISLAKTFNVTERFKFIVSQRQRRTCLTIRTLTFLRRTSPYRQAPELLTGW